MTDSQQLLTEYSRSGSEAAFHELLTRYLDFVYSAALRLVDGDSHQAEDVAQTVFVDLSSKARGFSPEVMLGGWLHRHTCYVAANVMRGERRRQARERQAVEMSALQQSAEVDFSKIAPILDEAINELDESDRAAIVLRFFEQRDFRSVGEAIGGSENGARMRVNRALDKLESLLRRRGVTSTAAALSVALAANVVQAAPVGMVGSIASAAGLGGATSATAVAAAKGFTVGLLQKGCIAAVVIASVALPIVVRYSTQQKLHARERELKQQAELLTELEKENERLKNLLAQVDNANTLRTTQLRELLQLRNRVGGLKRDVRELAQLKSASSMVSNAQPDAVSVWLARADQLRQWAEAHPEERIPEMQLLDDQQWIDAIYPMTLETDEEMRQAMSTARANAELRALDALGAALRKYGTANNGQYPATFSDLGPFLRSPLGDDTLARYELVPAESLVKELQNGEKWLITLKAPVDATLDSRMTIGMNGGGFADVRVTNRWAKSQ